VHNPGEWFVSIKEGVILTKLHDPLELDYEASEEKTSPIKHFIHLTKTIMRAIKPSHNPEAKEQDYTDKTPLLPELSLAELPEIKDIKSSEFLKALDINLKLPKNQKKQLEKVLLNHQKAFSLDGQIGQYQKLQYEIKLKPDVHPVSLAPYNTSPEKQEAIDKQIDKWLALDVTEPADSPWGALVVVVFRGGKARICVDYHKVNALSLSDEYPLPRLTDILQALSGSQWLSSFDALSGFQQLEVKKEHKPITAFRSHRGLYQFKQLPFGLHNGPSVFQRVMNEVLAPLLWIFVLVYIDNIIIFSKSFGDHLVHLHKVLLALDKANITLSPPKCHIGYQSLILLGQCVSRLGVSTHKEKVDVVQAFKTPTKVKDLQMVLGMVNYFSNYIPFYTWISKPLYALFCKDTIWELTELHQSSYDLCKLALTSAPVLTYAKPSLGCCLTLTLAISA
jgi:hypothetical protein